MWKTIPIVVISLLDYDELLRAYYENYTLVIKNKPMRQIQVAGQHYPLDDGYLDRYTDYEFEIACLDL